jgi:two-component system sensor histidine kinase YesM
MTRLRRFLYDYLTLKRRIFLIFLFNSLLPFITIVLLSFFTIYSILTHKIQAGIQSNLRQVELTLENSINNLNHVSQQLAFGGSIGNKLDAFLSAEAAFDRSKLLSELKEELGLITFTNPSIGLTLYYFANDQSYVLENSGVKEPFQPQKLPLLVDYGEIAYYGPHISNNRFDNQYVLSVLRKVDLPHVDNSFIYIETGFQLTQSMLLQDASGGSTAHVFLDNNGRIGYSDAEQAFPVGMMFPHYDTGEMSGTEKGYYWFREVSNQGWSIISLTPKSVYNREMNRWFVQITLVSLLFLGLCLFLAWLLWKMVYRPLNGFNKEIKLMSQNRRQTAALPTRIPEFDFLLHQFHEMKEQIWQLFAEVEAKEKRRVDLEVEKLLYQINPHFLMNTLDTVHWLAVMNGQQEIDRLVSSLNKLLHYNLGKLGKTSTIQEEIEALRQYLILQQIRYDFQFSVHIHAEEEALKIPTPRFILQPLVENSLYHGLNDDGYIEVAVQRGSEPDKIVISIRDNGSGMSQEQLERLFEVADTDDHKVGMGIGINYVLRMIDVYYGGKARLQVTSEPGLGTEITLILPTGGEG